MMNTEMKRRSYSAPNAEVVVLVPGAPVAASWQWKKQDESWKTNHWGIDLNKIDLSQASVTGLMDWVGEDELN